MYGYVNVLYMYVTNKYHIYCPCVSTQYWPDRGQKGKKKIEIKTKKKKGGGGGGGWRDVYIIYGGLILPYLVDRDHVHIKAAY
jgi:hypothetical protein